MNNSWDNHRNSSTQSDGSNSKTKKTLVSGRVIIGVGILGIFSWIFLGTNTSSDSNLVNTAFSPTECDYLSDQGFPTNTYHRQDDDHYICLSDYIDIGKVDSTGIESTIDYAVEGTSKEIIDIYLRGSYRNQSSQREAQQKFIKMSTSLILQITGQQAPQKLMYAIKNGKEFKGNINGKKMHLERWEHAGYGYTQVLTIYYQPKT